MSLHECSSTGDLERLLKLIAQNVDLNMKDYSGRTPLHVASQSGNVAIVKELLKYNVNVNDRDSGGWTPLHRVCVASWFPCSEQDLSRIVQLLIEHGADANIQKDDGYTALHLASLIKDLNC